jgi:hypothetical protein
MDDKKEEIVKKLYLILISLFGYPGNSESDSSCKVFKSVTGYLSETVKALSEENLNKLYSKKVEITSHSNHITKKLQRLLSGNSPERTSRMFSIDYLIMIII